MDFNHKIKLNNGTEIPIFGLGTYLSKSGDEAYNSVKIALENGYRHIDTAAFYQNEEDIGKAVADSGIDRSQIFITTKLWNSDQGYESALKAFDISLKKLNMDYIDLYLIHWPQTGTRKNSWKALEKIYESGKAKAIGVSNYTIRHLDEMKHYANITPAVNQVEFSVFLYQKELLDYCNLNGIALEAYTSLVRGKKFNDKNLINLANKYNKSVPQIMLKWVLEHNVIVIPKSVGKERIIKNADIFDFNISSEDMALLDSLNENLRVAWDPTNID